LSAVKKYVVPQLCDLECFKLLFCSQIRETLGIVKKQSIKQRL